ncbi:MAG: inositol monophosphatase [Coriobacteriia bacterium]|nr:inositol monophosphatase [Coriobacteriia bacterium]MBN2823534.1 inositol monophosphatase [Coriobacteriia bacterium]
MNQDLTTAISAARAGGDALKARAGDLGAIRIKSSRLDMVTDADVASGVAVCSAIAERLEGARFVVEEPEVYALAGVDAGSLDDPSVWVIDPIDGTTSFVHGFPCYSVSVALLSDGVPVVGVVYNVPAEELVAASVGGGTTLNGVSTACTDTAAISESLIMTGFPYDREAMLRRQLAIFSEVMRTVHGIRRDGSAAVDCCHVATGRADAFWEFGLQAWDTAAGVVALRESGAVVTDHDGGEWTPQTRHIVAANPVLHAELLELIQRVSRP